ncbi:hypothetical protein FVEN_g1131 [Fusarium venenatum]|uniref:Uncharacterized protein n=1 Tax=Fusarium venenatum TaxID=56646 RepID=A0A2L2TJS7_9HYPO|nr:uncharacterized protein FVRRES_10435 [Fusarium venenatum]KAG8361232.1 hypothetical protein FVEN_g1131 [Fusarium venenatum]KAH6967037.1 hypothetical protein EDB82DRAFT_562836 [Fusarium venenatum]CEI70358.1 unnamed protein product [Fusarium venenatum]
MAEKSFGWLSEAVKWPSLIFFAVFDIALVVAIVILSVKSSTEHGFIGIPSPKVTATRLQALPWRDPVHFNVSFDIGILWTTLPNLVFALFAAHWAWIACAIAERQPYVELRARGGAEARKSILLDYRVTPVVFRWRAAFRKSHNAIGAMTLLSVMLTYITAPFAARLFTTQVISVPKTIPIVYDTEFKGSNMNAMIDWRPVLNVVAATLLYQGKNIAWTNDQYALRPFSNQSSIPASADIEAKSTGFASYVNCELIKDYTITVNKISNSEAGNVVVSGNDRGCNFTQKFSVSSKQKTYLKSTSVIDCSAQAYYSRMVFSAGTYSASSSNLLDDIGVISCATGYRQVDGNLKVSSLNISSSVHSFDETGHPDTSRPYYWRNFEQGILGPVTFNPQASSSTSDMASLILSYAKNLRPSQPLSPEVLIQSISTVYSATYINGVEIHGFSPVSEPEINTGEAFIPTTRLFVVRWVAYIVLIFLLVALFFDVWASIYVYKRPSILTEEPQGLLSEAAILHKSGILRIISSIHNDPDFNGEVRQTGKNYTEVKDKKWMATKDDKSNQWVISSI